MPDDAPTYDVAISFLHEDLAAAERIRDELGDSLDVFVYSKKQEDIAGTDGLETFRDVFRRQARLVVILLRDRWGSTPWTRVEMEAITDRFLAEGPQFLFVVTMADCAPPPWLPEKLIRFGLKEFGLAQAVGAIRARAIDRGSELRKASPAFLAERAQRRAEFGERRRALLRNDRGLREAAAEAERLMTLIRERTAEAQATAPGLQIVFGSNATRAVARIPSVSVECSYRNNVTNVLEDARLYLIDFRGQVLHPGESGYYRIEPKQLDTIEFCPDLTQEMGWCWRDNADAILASERIADLFIEHFFRLVDKQSSDKLPRLDW